MVSLGNSLCLAGLGFDDDWLPELSRQPTVVNSKPIPTRLRMQRIKPIDAIGGTWKLEHFQHLGAYRFYLFRVLGRVEFDIQL